MARLETLLLIAAIALIFAWIVKLFVAAISGGESDSVFSTWCDILGFRKPVSCAENTSGVFKRSSFSVGDRIRVLLLPLELERSMSKERRELFKKCAGHILRVEGIDEFGALELHVLDDGSQSPGRNHHVLFLDPSCAERITGQV